jgi:hypothetical protein
MDEDDNLHQHGQVTHQGRKQSGKKKRDSFLGELDPTEDASSDDGTDQKRQQQHVMHYLGNVNLASSNQSNKNQENAKNINQTFEANKLYAIDEDTSSEINTKKLNMLSGAQSSHRNSDLY